MKGRSKKSCLKKGTPSHPEGKYFCDCVTRNYRKWLFIKLYGWGD